MNNKILNIAIKTLLAAPFIIFGLNKFIGFADMPPPSDETAQMFLGAMFSSYLVKLVAIIEIGAGILILVPRTSFLGVILMLPVTVNIVGFHLFHDLPGNGIWIFSLIMQLAALVIHKEQINKLLLSA